MIVNIVKKYNERFILFICEELNLDATTMCEKYLTPYYYMPIIEQETLYI